MKVLGALVVVVLVWFSAGSVGAGEPVSRREYVDRALLVLQRESIDAAGVDWGWVAEQAHARAEDDLHGAVEFAIAQLHDRHTQLFLPGFRSPVPEKVPSGGVTDGIGILVLPAFSADEAAARRYVDAAIAVERTPAPCGWIVDLRDNYGGNMGPMLTAAAPLLGDGGTGFFVYADGHREPWGLRDGQVYGAAPSPEPNPVRLPSLPHVAVVTSANTASSGEAVAVAFRGAARFRSFGTATAGWATGNVPFGLPDGATLNVTAARDADRTGHVYGNSPISPDVPTAADQTAAASAWLHSDCH